MTLGHYSFFSSWQKHTWFRCNKKIRNTITCNLADNRFGLDKKPCFCYFPWQFQECSFRGRLLSPPLHLRAGVPTGWFHGLSRWVNQLKEGSGDRHTPVAEINFRQVAQDRHQTGSGVNSRKVTRIGTRLVAEFNTRQVARIGTRPVCGGVNFRQVAQDRHTPL